MSKGLEELDKVLDHNYFTFLGDIQEKYEEEIDIIKKELQKPQELYNKIKEKRDNARLIREEHTRKQDISDEEKSEIYAEICAYNDILLLMRSMFKELENEN